MSAAGANDGEDRDAPNASTTIGVFRAPTRWVGHPTVFVETTDSTNDDARAAATAGAPHGHTIVANEQRAGRGRHGRTWHSPPGDNVYLSVVLRPRAATSLAPLVTLGCGLAVRDAIATFVSADRVTIKWPNDVRIDGRKVAGILVESALRGTDLAYVIVGIGLNVRGTTLPPDLSARATTLELAGAVSVRRDEVLRALLPALEARLDALWTRGAADTIAAVASVCDTLGQRVSVDGVTGTATHLGNDGALWLETDHGNPVAVHGGEVVVPDLRFEGGREVSQKD